MSVAAAIAVGLAVLFTVTATIAFLAAVTFDRLCARLSEPLEQPRERRADLNETHHGSSF